jgi:hypothetical protein
MDFAFPPQDQSNEFTDGATNTLRDKYLRFVELYQELKQEVRRADRSLFERWKAGGFVVDTDIVSMYPNLEEVAEALGWLDESEESDEEELTDE